MMHRFLIGTAALALAAAPAFAGGVPVAPVAPVVIADPEPVSDWTGAYIGLGFGSHETFDDGETGTGEYHSLFAGYLYDLGTIVVGAELGYTSYPEFDLFGSTASHEVYGRLRAGFDAGDFLPYLTIGIAHHQYDDFPETDYLPGAGIGVEYQASDNLRIGLEVYRGHDSEFNVGFADFDYRVTTTGLRVAYTF